MARTDPEAKRAYAREYSKRPDRKAKALEYQRQDKARAYQKAYRQANKERIAAQSKEWRQNYELRIRRPKKYGMTPAELEAMEGVQEQCCAICGQLRKLFIDHDHQTGQVRGLLCPGCNSGLGYFEEDEEYLTRAIAYLRERKANA